MYYYGLCTLLRKDDVEMLTNVFPLISERTLNTVNQPSDSIKGSKETDSFSQGLQVTGLISHSHRMVRRAKFDQSLKDLIASVLAERVELSQLSKEPRFINAHELVSLKLLAISLAKEQAVFWKKPKQAQFAI